MEIDPELYKPLKIDDAFHCQPSPGFEWWYFDSAFDNGYSCIHSWHIAGKAALPEPDIPEPGRVTIAIYDPEGKRTAATVGYPVSAISASRETCDVKMGDNHLHGQIPRYEVHILSGDLGCDLVCENLTQGYRGPPDGAGVIVQDPLTILGHVIAQPRAKVTGKLILAGKEIPVNGEGYHDKNWGNIPLQNTLAWWYWGRIYMPGYTIVYGMTSAGGRLIMFKGEKLMVTSPDLSVEGSDFKADAVAGVDYPQKVTIKANDPRVKGEIIQRLKYVMESPQEPAISVTPIRYYRLVSDCSIKLVADGEKIDIATQLVHEFLTQKTS